MLSIFNPGEDGLVARVFSELNDILVSSATTIANTLSTPSTTLLKTFFSLVIVFYLYQSVMTRTFDVKSFAEVILRIAIFWALVTSGAWLAKLVLPIVIDLPLKYGTLLTGGLNLDDGNPILGLSDLAALVWKNVQLAVESIEGNFVEKMGKIVLLYAVGLLAIITVGLMIIASFVYIGGGQIVCAVLICVFPLFAAFGFLPATKDLFQAWIRGAIWAVVLQLVAYTILALVLKMFDKIMRLALLEGKGLMENTETAITVLGTAALLAGLGTTMIRMTPMITGLLGSANIHIGGIYPEKKFYGAAGGLGKRAAAGIVALGAAAMARGGAAGARGRASAAADRAERIVNK